MSNINFYYCRLRFAVHLYLDQNNVNQPLKMTTSHKDMDSRLNLADAQFIGYYFGKWNGTGIIGLVQSMGLTKEEWERLKNTYPLYSNMDSSDINEIDGYFEKA